MARQAMTERDAALLVAERADSPDWWVLPLVSGRAMQYAAQIHRKFYVGAPNEKVQFLPTPWLAICDGVWMGHRSVMSPPELARLVADPYTSDEDLLGEVVLIFPDEGAEFVAMLGVEQLKGWCEAMIGGGGAF